jgi:pimeloyl-ACP methyl ester carboxylesterase
MRSGANGWIDRKIAAPVMLICDERDFALGRELTCQMKLLFRGPFELRYIADLGRRVQQERPDLVDQTLVNFWHRC